MRPDGSDAIPGFMTQLTLTGGFANKTLFEQAGVAMPGDGATWDDWVEASAKVATRARACPRPSPSTAPATASPGPNVSYGANYIGEDGMPAPVDEGVTTFVEQAGELDRGGHDAARRSGSRPPARPTAPPPTTSSTPRSRSTTPGSWQVANLSTKIGDAFDWVATGSPCGTAACSGLAGGAALVAIKYTKNPEEVAKVMD